MRLFKKPWTDLSKSPKEIIDTACLYLAEELSGEGFERLNNQRVLAKNSRNGHFKFQLTIGTTARNQTGARVHLNVHFVVRSNRIQKWRKDLYKCKNWGDPSDLVTERLSGYLTPPNKAESGQWDLLKTHPKKVVEVLRRHVIPKFDKFENCTQLLAEMKKGRPNEFCFEFEVLDFLMCFGGAEYASECLANMLRHKEWLELFEKKSKQLREEGTIDERHSLVNFLVHRADYFNIPLISNS